MLPGLAGIVGFLSNVKTRTYLSVTVASGSVTSATVSGASLGTVSGDRRIVVAVGSATVSSPSMTVTVGGVSATLLTSRRTSPQNAALYIAHVPTGATGDIVVSFGTTATEYSIAAWAVYGLSSNTPLDTDGATISESDVGAATMTTVENGVTIAFVDIASTETVTWTNVTEDFDVSPEEGYSQSGASASNSGTSLTVTATLSGAVNRALLVVATF